MTMKLFLQKTALLLMLAALLSGAASCSKNSATEKPSNIDYWTCTMHPSVREKGPGKCPICSMDLVPVMKESATPASSSKNAPRHDHAAMLAGKPTGSSEMQGMPGMPGMKGGVESKAPQTSEFVVPVERQQQIGVRYAKVERKPLRHTIRAVGLIAPDKTRNWQFVSRVDGYVQKLDVTAPGELVEKDAPLLSIYSPDLLTSEREFVELLRMRDQAKSKDARDTPQRLIDSAKRRLQLWNVTPQQISELEKTRKASDTLTLLSPFRGVVQSVPVEQGKSVKTGDLLVEV
ncbi:MAG: efflux RND transporter periplasmic adaptor subunit, partial [Verrucomicrobia bacterium]